VVVSMSARRRQAFVAKSAGIFEQSALSNHARIR
jgi:hypothetical protein